MYGRNVGALRRGMVGARGAPARAVGREIALFALSSAALGLALATILSLFAPTYWVLDLIANFPMQIACAQISLAIGLIALGSFGRALVFLAPLPLLIFRLVPLFEPRTSPPHTGTTLRVLSFNVQVASDAHGSVLGLIRESNADIAVLEDISMRWERALTDVKSPYRFVCASERVAGRGLAFIARVPVKSCETVVGPARIPILRSVIEWDGQDVVVFGVQAPLPILAVWAASRDAVLAEVSARARAERIPVIITGDFSATPWSSAFQALTEASGLESSHLGFGWQPTFPSYTWILGVPFDHLLHSSSLVTLAHETGPASLSNHTPLLVTLARAR